MPLTMHPEDTKAALRKRYGTVSAFERAAGIPSKSVSDVLRGRKSARVSKAIEGALADPIDVGSRSGAAA